MDKFTPNITQNVYWAEYTTTKFRNVLIKFWTNICHQLWLIINVEAGDLKVLKHINAVIWQFSVNVILHIEVDILKEWLIYPFSTILLTLCSDENINSSIQGIV